MNARTDRQQQFTPPPDLDQNTISRRRTSSILATAAAPQPPCSVSGRTPAANAECVFDSLACSRVSQQAHLALLVCACAAARATSAVTSRAGASWAATSPTALRGSAADETVGAACQACHEHDPGDAAAVERKQTVQSSMKKVAAIWTVRTPCGQGGRRMPASWPDHSDWAAGLLRRSTGTYQTQNSQTT